MGKGHGVGVVGFGGGCFSCLCRARSLFSCSIFLGEALFSSLALPVVVAYAPSVDNQPAAKLPEHGAGGHDSDLPGTVRVRKNFLVNKIVLLGLGGNDLVERSILVKE